MTGGELKFGEGEIRAIGASEDPNKPTVTSDLVPPSSAVPMAVPWQLSLSASLGAPSSFGYYLDPRIISTMGDILMLFALGAFG